MSTNIYNKGKMILTSFYGGARRGRCLQFTIGHERIEYTEEEVREVADVVNTWLLQKPQ